MNTTTTQITTYYDKEFNHLEGEGVLIGEVEGGFVYRSH